MSAMLPDSGDCGQKVRRICCPRSLTTRLLVLTLVLAIGLMIIVHQFGNIAEMASRRERGVSSTRASLYTLHQAVSRFHADNGRWPTQAEGLSALIKQPADVTNWPPGGYLEATEIPKDEWGHDFIFELDPGDGIPFVIKSLGADGADGGEEYDADMLSVDLR